MAKVSLHRGILYHFGSDVLVAGHRVATDQIDSLEKRYFGHYSSQDELRNLKEKDLDVNGVTKKHIDPEMALRLMSKPSTSASESQPLGNTKKDKIQQTPSNTQKNKVEARTKTCNGCMLSDNHDLCVLDFINDVNARAKSKYVKKRSKRKIWKPTGKVFTNIGYTWIPTGLVPNPLPSTSFVPPSRTDWDILFQPLFDELLNPPLSVDRPAPKVIAPLLK
ncbi:hypothetical protein Tco_0947264 [Tanacetum coccineum]